MPRGGFGGGFGRGGFGRGFGMRRFGAPLVMPMGGYGMGMGSPLLTTLMAGGLGYALGSNSAQPGVQQAPPYQQPYPYPYPYQAPPAAPQGQGAGADSGKLAQLQLLGELHELGTLTDDEFRASEAAHPGRLAAGPGGRLGPGAHRRRCGESSCIQYSQTEGGKRWERCCSATGGRLPCVVS